MNSIERDTDYELTCQVDPSTMTPIIWTRHIADPLLPGEVRLGNPAQPLDEEGHTFLFQVLAAFIASPDEGTATLAESNLYHLGFDLDSVAVALNALRSHLRSL